MPVNDHSTCGSTASAAIALGTVILVVAATIAIPASTTFANDSFARIGAGGITFVKTDDVRMLEEDLWISKESIRVKYRFLNQSDRDIRTTVAFPLPPRGPYKNGISSDKVRRSFVVRVNDRPVATTYHRKAVIADHDITPLLRKAGLSDSEIFHSFGGYGVDRAGRIRWNLPRHLETELRRLLGEITRGPSPWKVSETLLWEQIFPAGKELAVEHVYTPLVGGRYDVPYQEGFGYMRNVDGIHFLKDNPCLDSHTTKRITDRVNELVAKGVGWITVEERDVEYILGTGRNWKGPIGVFKLTIKKDAPDQFTSVCFPGPSQEVSSTVQAYVRKDFIAPDRLVVHFITVEPSPMPDDDKLSEGESLLLWAAHGGQVEQVKSHLDNGVNVNAVSQMGWTPLIWAAERGHTEVVKILLERGAEVNAKNSKGWTALKMAQEQDHSEIEMLLRSRGAKE